MTRTRILLADDHAIVRAGIRKTIEEIPNIEVVKEVGDGLQVFEALAKDQVDCLLIDVTMPEFEPITAIRKIRASYPTLKILVVSAYDDDFYVQGLLRAGVNGYHMKDQSLNDLKLAVQRVLAGERWITSSLLGKLINQRQMDSTTPDLTNRQKELLRLLQQGMDNKSIAQETGLSVKTVENHLTHLYRLLDVQSRLEAANYILHHPQVIGTSDQDLVSPEIQAEAVEARHAEMLIVDDNARYRKQLQRTINKLYPGLLTHEAENTRDAAQIARQRDIQLALIDVVLGDEDGIACTRKLKAIRPQCRIILISAYPDREFHRLGLESGAVAFLDKKDLDLSTLRQVVNDTVG